MNDEAHTQDQRGSKQKPYLLGYTVREAANGNKSYWSKVAIAWEHKDGLGFNIQMDALPVDGKLVLRTVQEDQDETGELFAQEPR